MIKRLKLNIQKFATNGTLTTPANEDGTTFYFHWVRQSYSIADNKSTIYWQIGINAAYSYYDNAVKLGTTTVNGQVIHSGGTYSNISRGTHTMVEGTMDIYHNTDGTKSFSASLSGWTWGCSWVSANNSSNPFILNTIPRYTSVTTWNVIDKTETSMTLSWQTAENVKAIKYGISTEEGEYTTVSDLNTNTGTVTIDNLTADTEYTLYFMPQRKDSSLWGDGSADTWKETTQKTWDYPTLSSGANFTIGGAAPLIQMNNPLSRDLTVTILTETDVEVKTIEHVVSSFSPEFTNTENTLFYNSIPNKSSGTYKVKTVSSVNTNTKNSGQYSINENDCKPTFSTFTYEDTDATILALTGDSSIIVKNYSDIRATITTANKAIAQNGATMKRYNMIVGGETNFVNYSDNSTVTISLNNVSSNVIKVNAEDSRGLTTEVQQIATSPDYYKEYTTIQKGNINIVRQGNVGQAVTVTFNGTYWNESFGDVTNTITSADISYRFKKTTDNNWTTGATTITPTLSNNTFTFNGGILGDTSSGFNTQYSYNIEITVADKLSSTTFTFVLGTGVPTIAVSSNGVAVNSPYNEQLNSGLQVTGKIYLNGEEFTGGGVDIPQQDTPPSNPEENDLWIDTYEAGATMLIDGAVSTTSTNAVQNQAITNYVNTMNGYSETETDTGLKWVNNKTIYKKVIHGTTSITLNSNAWASTGISITNLEAIINCSFINVSNWTIMPMCAFYDTNYNSIQLLNLRTVNVSTNEWYLTLEYTKTS